jgi:hypothetical protein
MLLGSQCHLTFDFDFGARVRADALVSACLTLPRRYVDVFRLPTGTLLAMESSRRTSNMETPMRKLMTTILLLAAALPASAQTTSPPANRDANTPAISSPNSPPNPGAPAAGANSFTEGQAKSRIEERGFKNVHDLKKDHAGVWRGKADQNGKAVNVSLDFQGNVVAQ